MTRTGLLNLPFALMFAASWTLSVSFADDVVSTRQVALAQESSKRDSADDSRDRSLSSDPELKALAFIEKHQPRLRKLLDFLKSKQPAAYEQALREMGRSQQRLEGLEKRDPELYEIELDLWLIRSRLRLLAAEMSVVDEVEQTQRSDELSKLVQGEVDRDLQRMQLLRDRAAQQMAKLDKEIADRKSGYDDFIAKSLKSWQSRIKKQSTGQRKSKP